MTDRPFPPVFATNRPATEGADGETVEEEINRLLRGLREQLAQPPSIAIATAYINAQGFALLADELERAPSVRLLIGVPSPSSRRSAGSPGGQRTVICWPKP